MLCCTHFSNIVFHFWDDFQILKWAMWYSVHFFQPCSCVIGCSTAWPENQVNQGYLTT
jgi:hypothetical protein